jgi:hypothetical protein
MSNCSTAAMEEGVKHSAHFLLFLSGDPVILPAPVAVVAAAAEEGVPPAPEPEPEPEPKSEPEPEGPESDFARLLRELGVLQYATALAEESIRSADDLRDLSGDDLKELGLKLGDRKRVLKWSSSGGGGGAD